MRSIFLVLFLLVAGAAYAAPQVRWVSLYDDLGSPFIEVNHGPGAGHHSGSHGSHHGYEGPRYYAPPRAYPQPWYYYQYYQEPPRSEFYYDGRTWSYRQGW